MKSLQIYINEYIVKKKLDKFVDSEDHYKYAPKTKGELIGNIEELIDNKIYDFNCIDTSNITDMSDLFYIVKDSFDIQFDVSNWDVSNVTNMGGLFYGCANFNCNLSNWNVSKVKNMSYMFYSCKNFDCDLSNWDVSNVEKIDHMFCECRIFIGNGLDNWNISKKVVDMSNMFDGCRKFNCNLSKWNTKRVKDMRYMFYNCDSLKNKPNWYKT